MTVTDNIYDGEWRPVIAPSDKALTKLRDYGFEFGADSGGRLMARWPVEPAPQALTFTGIPLEYWREEVRLSSPALALACKDMPRAGRGLRKDYPMAHDRMRHDAARAFIRQPLKKGRAWAELSYAYDYETEDAMYLGWFDDNPKKALADKIAEAIQAYQARYSIAPNVVLVNEADRVEHPSVSIRVETYIRRNNFWVGYEGRA